MPENEEWDIPEDEDWEASDDEEWESPEDEERQAPENEEEEVPEDEEEDVPEDKERDVPRKKHKKFSWKSVLLTVVVFAVLGSLFQTLRGGGFGGSISTGEEESQKEPKKGDSQELKRPKKPKSVKMGTRNVPRTAGAIVVINPGLVTPGTKATIEGAGFDAKSTVDLLLKSKKSDTKGKNIGTVKSDKNGEINAQFRMPEKAGSASVTVVAQQRGADKVAQAEALSGGGVGTVKINKAAGKPGDSVTVSASGFKPGEGITVYWGRVTGTPAATLRADGSGSIGRANVKVGVAPRGNSTLVLVGQKSKSTATAPFQMLGLYPSVTSKPYALKAAQQMTVSARGFAPGERVLFYINSASGVPAFTANADARGGVSGVALRVPFGLKGPQRLMAMGEKTRAIVRASFSVLPYTPSAEPSAYGGKAGTTISFYVSGFGPNEKVTIYAGGTEGGGGKKVGTFQVDARGKADAVGAYKITKAGEGGVSFRLVGDKSGSTAQASVNSQQKGKSQDK